MGTKLETVFRVVTISICGAVVVGGLSWIGYMGTNTYNLARGAYVSRNPANGDRENWITYNNGESGGNSLSEAKEEEFFNWKYYSDEQKQQGIQVSPNMRDIKQGAVDLLSKDKIKVRLNSVTLELPMVVKDFKEYNIDGDYSKLEVNPKESIYGITFSYGKGLRGQLEVKNLTDTKQKFNDCTIVGINISRTGSNYNLGLPELGIDSYSGVKKIDKELGQPPHDFTFLDARGKMYGWRSYFIDTFGKHKVDMYMYYSEILVIDIQWEP